MSLEGSDRARGAAQEILVCWRRGEHVAALAKEHRPRDLAEGYAAQAALEALSGEAVRGWKVAATSAAGQAHIAVSGPIAGRLLASRVHPDGSVVAMGANRMAVAEAEFAFVLGRDLPWRERPYAAPEILAAVASLHPAIELPDSRFEDFTVAGEGQLAADNACAHEFVLGPPAACDWRALDLSAHPVTLHVNGQAVTHGSGADVLGSPSEALAWLANAPPLAGRGLRAGEIVTTGVCGRPSPIRAGDMVRADFGVLGAAAAAIGP